MSTRHSPYYHSDLSQTSPLSAEPRYDDDDEHPRPPGNTILTIFSCSDTLSKNPKIVAAPNPVLIWIILNDNLYILIF